MSTVYTSTYLTANYTAAACKVHTHLRAAYNVYTSLMTRPRSPLRTAPYTTYTTKQHQQELDIDYKVPTAVATSLVNMVAIAWKDRNFARMMSKEPTVFPLASYGACLGWCPSVGRSRSIY